MAALVAGWAITRDAVAVVINRSWLAVAAAWYVAGGRRAAARR